MTKKSIIAGSNKFSALFLVLAIVISCSFTPISISAATPYTNLVLESVFFTDGKGMVELSPSGKNGLVPYVVISKKEDSVPLAGTIIVGIYDGSRLTDISTFPVSSASTVFGEKRNFVDRTTFQGPAVNFPVNGIAKAFFWDSTNKMFPYIKAIDSNMAASSQQYTGPLTFPAIVENKLNNINRKITITKQPGIRKYTHDSDPNSLFDWSEATEIFLKSDVAWGDANVIARDGTIRDLPIAGRNFATNFTAGKYKKADGVTPQTDFIFTLLDDYYSGATDVCGIPLNNLGTATTTNISSSINALIRSGSPSGFTWMGRLRRQTVASDGISSKWSAVTDKPGVYKTVQGTSTANVMTLFNFNAEDSYGLPRPYVLVDSLDLCAATKGSFYQDPNAKSNIYCNPRDGEQLDDITLQIFGGLIDGIRNASDKTVVFQNIGLMPNITSNSANQYGGADYDKAVFGFFGCKMTGGAVNGISLQNKYTAYLFDCVCGYAFRDGLNFHSTVDTDGSTSTVIQVNCISYCHGDMNRIYLSGPIIRSGTGVWTNNSNNCSTTHDGIKSLRIGGKGWNSQGCIIGDLSSYAITMGYEAYNINPDTPSDRTAIFAHDDISQPATMGKLKYVIDCLGTGSGITAGLTGNENTYYLDFVGYNRICLENSGTLDPLKPITWAEIASGTWKEPQ